MPNQEGLSPKMWLEGYHVSKKTFEKPHKEYHCKKHNLNSQLQKDLGQLIKNEKRSWHAIIHTVWAILLSRYSTSPHVSYGLGTLSAYKSKKCYLSSTEKNIQLSIEKTTKICHLLDELNSQTKNTRDDDPIDTRYLLLYQAKKNASTNKARALNPADHSLILCVDQSKYDQFSIYYADSFSDEMIESFAEHLILLLEKIVKNTDFPVYQLDLLTEDEKEKLLNSWSRPHYPFVDDKFVCSHDIFMQIAAAKPKNIAVSSGINQLSYQALDQASDQLADQLIKLNVNPNDTVCALLDRGIHLITSILAIWKCGATYVPINPKYPPERIAYVLEDSNAKCILIDDIKRLAKKFHPIAYEVNQELNFEKLSQPFKKIPTTPDTIAYIIYTSGTTGMPKGVKIKHKSLANLNKWYHHFFKIKESDRSSQFASQGFDSFICETIPFLNIGASVHIIDDNTKLSPSAFFKWLCDKKITVCDLPTAYAKMLFLLPWPKELSLRLLKIGGESMPHFLNQRFSFDVWNGYGPTETTVETSYFKLYTANSSPEKCHQDYDKPPIGKPISGTEAYIVDQYLEPVPMGVAGELLIGGFGVSPGYLNRPDLNKEKFIPNKFHHQDKLLYRTGDLARWLPDGNLEFLGRIDHQVKISGYRIELAEIENVINQYPDVNEVVVIAKENLQGKKSLIAYVKPNLDKERYLYQERCLVSISPNKYIEAVTEDISKNGLAITGITDTLRIGQKVVIQLRLPGLSESKSLTCHLVWQEENRSGFVFDLSPEDRKTLEKSIDYYLSCHNAMELVLSASAKRSLRKALKKKLPGYMIPSTFVTLLEFPLTFSGKIDLSSLPPPGEFEMAVQNQFIEPNTETEKKLALIWKKVLNRKTISLSDNFFDIGGSSLTAAELSIEILKNFNISIPTKVLFDLPYIPVIAQYIESNGKSFVEKTFIQEEIEHDSILHENINPLKKLSSNIKHPEHILLTGAGGFLGIYLLRELLKHTEAKIYCIIRTGEFETAAKRLNSTIERFHLSQDISLSNRRIIAIPGDISFENFGMPLNQYTSMAEKIDLIFHCGAQVNIMASYNHLRNSNVEGTIEVIKFATRVVDKPIHYISTLSSVVMKDKDDYYIEAFPDDSYGSLFGGYALSKWVSERLLTQLHHRGLPVTIYRSGYISGQSDSGIINLNDGLFMLIKGCIQLGYAPKMVEKITILPVDFVSALISQISLKYVDDSAVYHIDHPTGILWQDLIAWLNDYGFNIKLTSIKEWKNMLVTIPKDNALYPFLPYYLSMDDDYQADKVDITYASAKAHELGLSYPEIDNKLLNTYFDYLTEIEFLPPVKKKQRVK